MVFRVAPGPKQASLFFNNCRSPARFPVSHKFRQIPRSFSISAVNSFKADIRADTNRAGIVDMTSRLDLFNKANWTQDRGAIFLPSIGDSNRRCSKIGIEKCLSYEELGNFHDASDDIQRAPQYLAPLRTVPMPDISESAKGYVIVPHTAQRSFVRIFHKRDGSWTIVGNDDAFSASDLRKGLVLGIDARDTRRPDIWDGRVTVRFTVKDGTQISSDEVELRVAPILVHNHLDKVQQILSTAGDETRFPWQHRFTQELSSVVAQTRLPKLQLFTGSDDPWAQDFVEPGYTSMPGSDGPMALRIHIRSSQDSRVAGRQVFERMRDSGVGAVQHLGGARDEINSMGNLECTPPFEHNSTNWPAGRIIMGKHGPYEPHILPYLRAQEAQKPILLDAAWLWVGHVDEFVQFLPVKTERGWVVVVADPEAGLKLIQELEASGHGDVPMYSRRTDAPVNGVTLETVTETNYGSLSVPVPEKSIDEFLSDDNVAIANLEAAKRINASMDILKAEIGITDAVIYRLPTLYYSVNRDEVPYNGPRAADEKLACIAVYPAAINGVVLTGFGTYLAPKPWGPVIDGEDVMAEAAKKVYEKLGWKIKFLDDWNSHHSYGGEVHCATNTVREMSRRWW